MKPLICAEHSPPYRDKTLIDPTLGISKPYWTVRAAVRSPDGQVAVSLAAPSICDEHRLGVSTISPPTETNTLFFLLSSAQPAGLPAAIPPREVYRHLPGTFYRFSNNARTAIWLLLDDNYVPVPIKLGRGSRERSQEWARQLAEKELADLQARLAARESPPHQ